MIKYGSKVENIFNVPNLEVPSLKKTQIRLKEWLKPLLNNEKFGKEERVIYNFFQSEDIKKLQKIVVDKSKDINGNYMSDWWMDGYLMSSGQVSSDINAPLVYENSMLDNFDQLEKIAVIIWTSTNVYFDFKLNGIKKL